MNSRKNSIFLLWQISLVIQKRTAAAGMANIKETSWEMIPSDSIVQKIRFMVTGKAVKQLLPVITIKIKNI